MCVPMVAIAAAQVAITAAAAAAEYDGQRRSANQQRDAELANLHARDASLQFQENQVNEQASQQMSERALEAMRQRGRLQAAFADSGVSGNSQVRAFNSVDMASGMDMATIEANRSGQIAQGQDQKRSASRQATQDIQAIRMPSLLGAGLKIVGSGIDAYSGYRANTANLPQNKAPKG
jgi:hypothetical protein